MAQYLAPGVYVEEVASAIKPIAGVGTSTAGFIGVVADTVTMPEIPGQFETTGTTGKIKIENGQPVPAKYAVAASGEPQLLTSWDAFRKNFGDIQAGNNTLAHAVYGFFNNGGTRCWVARMAADDVTAVLTQFEAIDEIALVAVPGALATDVQNAVLDHCEKMADRFVILDGAKRGSSKHHHRHQR